MERFLSAKKVSLVDCSNREEFYYELTNVSDEVIYIDTFVLYEQTDLREMGLCQDDCVVYRSGRHKNDMPSVFLLGCCDEAMKDAMSGMTETGDKKAGDSGAKCILSDHLTVLGNEDGYVVITFPEGRKQLVETAIYVDEDGKFERLQSRVVLRIKLNPQCTIMTEPVCIERTKDVMAAVDTFAKNKAKLYGKRNGARPSVFCTWYYYGLTVTYDDVKMNLNKMKARKLPFDVFQVDEGWEITLGEWKPNHKFPIPMKDVADEIKEAGYRPGIWTSPFVAHETATVWKEHPEWALHDEKGDPCLFHMNDTVYWVFDITNPATWDYFYELYRMLTFDWGYTYHKLDFTRAAVIMENAVYYDDSITLVEAYYHAVSAIRDGMGEDSYFLMCGGLYDPIVGLVDAQRTGSDVLSMWSSTINKDGKTAPYTMKQSILRYYMNEWWDNDPDALMVRVNPTMERNLRLTYGLLNDEEVKTSVINQYMGGGLVCSTEPLDKIDDERLGNLRRVMPAVKSKCQPLNLLQNERFPNYVKISIDAINASSLVWINWSDDEDLVVRFTLEESMLKNGCEPDGLYTICDYYGHVYARDVHVGDLVTMSTLKPHASTIIKIQKQENQPIIVESTGHFSMGAEGIELDFVEGKLCVEYENRFDWPIEYTILLPQGWSVDGGNCVRIVVDRLATIKKEWRCEYEI